MFLFFSIKITQKLLNPIQLFLSFYSVPLAMPASLEATPSSYSTLRVSWGAAPSATQYMILYSALSHGEPDDAKEVRTVQTGGFIAHWTGLDD